MKKITILLLISFCMICLVGCSNASNSPGQNYSVEPYQLNEREQSLLNYMGLGSSAYLFTYNAPYEAITMEVRVYQLTADGIWQEYAGGAIGFGEDREIEPIETLSGVLSIIQRENHAFDMIINSAGQARYTIPPINTEFEQMMYIYTVLSSPQQIELNQEIPLAIFVYDDGTSINSFAEQAYFTPEEFAGRDLVQAITIIFKDEQL